MTVDESGSLAQFDTVLRVPALVAILGAQFDAQTGLTGVFYRLQYSDSVPSDCTHATVFVSYMEVPDALCLEQVPGLYSVTLVPYTAVRMGARPDLTLHMTDVVFRANIDLWCGMIPIHSMHVQQHAENWANDLRFHVEQPDELHGGYAVVS